MNDPSRATHAVTVGEALARVMQTMADSEHPIREASIWKYSDSVSEGGFGWRVVEVPEVVQHGTDKKTRSEPTKWNDLAKGLIADLDRIRESL